MKLLCLLLLILPSCLLGQSVKTTNRMWEISTSFSYGSENNIGNPGFMLTSEYERFVSKRFSVSGRIGFFYSMPWFHIDDLGNGFTSYGCLSGGVYLNHTARFAEDRNYVRLSGGLSYFHSTSFIEPNYIQTEVISKFGYGLSLEGGRFVSQKVALGGLLQIYSYEIFGDITVLGVNARFRLN